MKAIAIYTLAILGVAILLYIGIGGILQNLSFGPFFTFVGGCTAIGLSIDITNHIKLQLRKARVRRLTPNEFDRLKD